MGIKVLRRWESRFKQLQVSFPLLNKYSSVSIVKECLGTLFISGRFGEGQLKFVLQKLQDIDQPCDRPKRKLKSKKSTSKHQCYRTYLKSDWWLSRREIALNHAGRKCEKCGRQTELQVHHLNYRHIGGELNEDLKVLCGDHHLLEHFPWLGSH